MTLYSHDRSCEVIRMIFPLTDKHVKAIIALLFCTTIVVTTVVQSVSTISADGSLPTLTNYYAPCAHNTAGTTTTLPRCNREGKPAPGPSSPHLEFSFVTK